MRIMLVAALSLFFTSSFAFGEEKQAKDPDPKTFKEAYAGYKKYANPKDRAEQALRTVFAYKAYELGLKKYGSGNINTANLAMNWVYAAAANRYNLHSPIEAFQKNIQLYEEENQSQPFNISDVYITAARILITGSERKKKSLGMKYYKYAISHTEKHFSANSKELGDLHLTIGKDLLYYYKRSLALSYIDKATKIYQKDPEKHAIEIAISNFHLAKFNLFKKRTDKAKSLMEKSLMTFKEKAPSHPIALSAHAIMISLLEKQGKSDEATKHCQAIGRATPYTPNQEYLPIYRKSPNYPRSAANRGKEGYVLLEFTVDKEGFVRDPKSIEYTGSKSFVKASIAAALKFRYAPQFKDGKPVDTEGVRNLITYELVN